MDESKKEGTIIELAKDIIKKAKKTSATKASEPPPTPQPEKSANKEE